MAQLITAYLNVTKQTNDGHCQIEVETYIHFIKYAADLFPLEVNEETKWTDDKMWSYLMIRAKSTDFVEIKSFILDGLIRRGYIIECVKMYADYEQLDSTLRKHIMNKRPRLKKKTGLLGFISRFTCSEDANGTIFPDECDEELWEDEE